MQKRQLTEQEKKALLREVLGTSYHQVGDRFPVFSRMMDGVSNFNDTVALAELIPALNTWTSGAMAGSFLSAASVIGVVLFPVQQTINLINSNETGLRFYSYRAVAYTITAWAYSRPQTMSSPRILSNIAQGVGYANGGVEEYNRVWRDTSAQVLSAIDKRCVQKGINKQHLKEVFKAMSRGKPEDLCLMLLQGFESQTGHTTKFIWRSGYKTLYPF